MNRFALLVFALACLVCSVGLPETVRVTTDVWQATTYPFSDPDPVPATGETRYPYFRYDGSSATPVTQSWRRVTLENGKIRVTLMPEIGGKVWGAADKLTGEDFIYHNHVVKFRDIAMRGPWCSGGIEYNFGIIGHAPSCSTPVDWCVRTNEDRSVSFFAASAEYVTRAWWQVEVRLRPGAERFETHTTWANLSGLVQPYYHWMNAAYSLRGNPRFLFPGAAYAGHEGDVHPWPRDAEGHALDVYRENAFGGSKSYHVLPGDNAHYAIWWPEKGLGSYHRALAHEKFGRKIWLWALSREGGIWENLLTDEDGQYAELQSGRYFIQPRLGNYATPLKYPAFSPGSTETFSETWGVLRDPKDFERVSERFPSPRPEQAPSDFDWTTAYGEYVRGRQHLLERHDAEAEACFLRALEKERHFVPALVALAAVELRRGDYAACHSRCGSALAVDTTDEGANYLDGFAYFAEGDTRSARDRLGVAAFGTRFRSAAFAIIGRACLRDGDRVGALAAADKALVFNSANLEAHLVRLVALRGTPEAERLQRDLLVRYPLFPGFLYERDGAGFARHVVNELAAETFRELAYWYRESGLSADAETLFALAEKAPGRLPPFRRESRGDLESAAHGKGWRAKYELGVLLDSFNLAERAKACYESCGNEPDDPVFYLVRGARRTGAGRLADFRRAAQVGDGWRVGRALARHFAGEMRWADVLATTRDYLRRFPGNNPLQLLQAEALVRLGRHREALDFLGGVTILPSEHKGSATEIWQRAQKALGLPVTYPENLGKGTPYPDAGGPHVIPQGAAVSPSGDRIEVTTKSLRLNGRAIVPLMGEMHYSRVPAEEWARSIRLMKEGGVSIVSSYVFWNHHEWKPGAYRFDGNRNLAGFLGELNAQGLWCVLRIGPWCHGEVREGGMPDWMIDRYGTAEAGVLRSADPAFLAEVRRFWGRLAEEVLPYLWKNGGPVIGIQLENESRRSWAYYGALKRMATDLGFDVPMYTRTGWVEPPGPEPAFGETIPLYGGYAAGFWDRASEAMPAKYLSSFRMHPGRTSGEIATDQFGVRAVTDAAAAREYPYFTCETGGGMASSYHRRLRMEPEDAFALAVVKLGSGSNLPGYYMYHGGTNPTDCGVPMCESQVGRYTGYNDLPAVSYEFMSPLSQFGEPQGAYWMIRALVDFCREHGEEFAEREPVFVSGCETRRGRFVFHNEYVRRLNPAGECWIGIERGGRIERVLDMRTLLAANPTEPVFPRTGYTLRKIRDAGTVPPVRLGKAGVATPPDECAWTNAAAYEVAVEDRQGILEVPYEGDMARLYADGVLVQDDFQKGRPFQYALWRLPGRTARLVFKVLPWATNAADRIFVDPRR